MGYPFFVLYQSHDIGSVRRSIGLVCWEETRSKVNVIGRGKGQGVRVVSLPNRRLTTRAPCGEHVLSGRARAKVPVSFYAELLIQDAFNAIVTGGTSTKARGKVPESFSVE